MDKKSIGELRRRLKKDSCTFTKMCGCYVDDSKNKVIKLDEIFLNLEVLKSKAKIILTHYHQQSD